MWLERAGERFHEIGVNTIVEQERSSNRVLVIFRYPSVMEDSLSMFRVRRHKVTVIWSKRSRKSLHIGLFSRLTYKLLNEATPAVLIIAYNVQINVCGSLLCKRVEASQKL